MLDIYIDEKINLKKSNLITFEEKKIDLNERMNCVYHFLMLFELVF